MEDERAQREGICGITEVGPTGIEWICIKQVHGVVYYRKKGDRTHRRGAPVFPDDIRSDAHYFVNRWPNRKKEDAEKAD